MKLKAYLVSICCMAVIGTATISHRASGADAAAKALPKEEAEGLIFERQQLMIQLDKDAEVLGEIAAGLQPPDKLAEVTRSIATAAKDMKATFETNVPGGRSKPEIWTNWPDYSRRMDSFAQNAEEMAKLGEAGNLAAVTGMLASALPCKECHDVYRAPKK